MSSLAMPLRSEYPLAVRKRIDRLIKFAFSPAFGKVIRPAYDPGVAAAASYITKVIGYGPIAYWPLNEAAGATAAVCQINTLQNGTPANVTFADTLGPDNVNYAPSFNGTSSNINIQTTTLAAKFPAAGTEGSLGFWFKVASGDVWTDGIYRYCLYISADANNCIYFIKSNSNNRIDMSYKANGTLVSHALTSFSPTTWTHFGMRWSDSGNLVEYFLNGVEIVGSQDVMNATWAGALTLTQISGYSTANEWSGWLAHVVLFNSAVSDAVMLGLGTPTA